jgi:hypothetical protein
LADLLEILYGNEEELSLAGVFTNTAQSSPAAQTTNVCIFNFTVKFCYFLNLAIYIFFNFF